MKKTSDKFIVIKKTESFKSCERTKGEHRHEGVSA